MEKMRDVVGGNERTIMSFGFEFDDGTGGFVCYRGRDLCRIGEENQLQMLKVMIKERGERTVNSGGF